MATRRPAPGGLLLCVGLLVLLALGCLALLLRKTEMCLDCRLMHGGVLLREALVAGKPQDPCDCCDGEGNISLLRKWIYGAACRR
ncbi:MAG TPA: hypothetical protein VF950_19980 [Planctomycetota bacterium]